MKRKVNILCAVLCGMVPFWLALVWLARRNPDGVERIYSQGFYPLWAGGLMAVTSALPFSLAEVLVITAALLAVFWLWSLVRALARGRGQRRRI